METIIYFVYECDAHKSYSSFVIKYAVTDRKLAKEKWKALKKSYKNSDYMLEMGSYVPNHLADDGNNLLSEIDVIKTTDK